MVLDGWGIAPSWGGNAISQAQVKNFNRLWQMCPSTTLLASGESVGLPAKSPGNSEAGHLNIGAGRIVHQDIALIDRMVLNKEIFSNKVLLGAIEHSKRNNSKIHLMGLLSTVGTHSHIRHLFALIDMMKLKGVKNVYIHLFSDGRDSGPLTGVETVDLVEKKIAESGVGEISTICGRYYAMDRDNRWGRVARAYNLYAKGEGNIYESPKAAFASAYAAGQTDEFIEPRMVVSKTQAKTVIGDNDAIIVFNFRSDRTKELIQAFVEPEIRDFPDRLKLNNLYLASFATYDLSNLATHAFSAENVINPIAQVWSEKQFRQLHIAETEKYPHVTYFFNGGVEKPFNNEFRILVPSVKTVRTYDMKPEMSAFSVKKHILDALRKNIYDKYVINFANTDMVGHTGNLEATISAAEAVDQCLGEIVAMVLAKEGRLFILADHGNAEQMVNPSTGDPDTEHTTNPVPFIIVESSINCETYKLRGDGILGDVVPTVLEIENTPLSPEMTGQSLVIKEHEQK